MGDGNQIEGMFTFDEALDYLRNQLGISDATDALSRDPLGLLNKMSFQYSELVPFQNITNISCPIGTISVPSMEQIKSEHLSGRGGMCYGHNRFFFELICALGYKAHLAGAHAENPDGHLIVIIDAMPNGDNSTTYFFDNGFGYPHHQAVPLDFDRESPVYNLGHTLFKITRDGDLYTRLTAKHDKTFVCAYEYAKGHNKFEWSRSFTFTTGPIKIPHLVKSMNLPYKNVFGRFGSLTFILVQGEVLHSIEDFDESTPELNVKHHQMKPSGTVSIHLRSVDDIVSGVLQLCPVLIEEELRTAIKNAAHYKRIFVQEKGYQWNSRK